MTLEEAIKHAEYIVNNRKYAISVCWSVKGCEQLAEWLRELQAWRKAYDDCVNTDYESIDDSVRRLTIIGQVVNVRNVFADIRRTDE